MTVRADRPERTVCVTSATDQLAFPPKCDGDVADAEYKLGIRTAGLDEDEAWEVLEDPVTQEESGVVFRLGGYFGRACPGYYDAVLFQDCDPCAFLRLHLTKTFTLSSNEATVKALSPVRPPDSTRPEGLGTMLDPWLGFKTKITCVLKADDTRITAADEFPTGEKLPDLVLDDGMNREIVTLTSIDGKSAVVQRDAEAFPFSKGTCLQFEWTSGNISCVAPTVEVEPEPEPEPDGTDADCAVFEVGKGLTLETTEQGAIKLSLSETEVAPGDYAGLSVDECGRVVGVNAVFPDVPVFDDCCKDEDTDE